MAEQPVVPSCNGMPSGPCTTQHHTDRALPGQPKLAQQLLLEKRYKVLTYGAQREQTTTTLLCQDRSVDQGQSRWPNVTRTANCLARRKAKYLPRTNRKTNHLKPMSKHFGHRRRTDR
uniref:Uncharacterized protein n=1 Tax=Anopheles albimanus TaxID=7167 RepID=A0A182FAQ8_ANOAL